MFFLFLGGFSLVVSVVSLGLIHRHQLSITRSCLPWGFGDPLLRTHFGS